MKFLRIAGVAALCTALFGASHAESISAQHKIDALRNGKVRRGSSLWFTSGEINSWLHDQATVLVPHGVSDFHLELDNGRITAFAQLDFLKMKQAATGQAPGWLANQLLSGKRPVTVTLRLQSRHHKARVDLERVEISGVPITGAALDFLVRTYLIPAFPEARPGEWFDLDWRIEQITVSPPGASVYVS